MRGRMRLLPRCQSELATMVYKYSICFSGASWVVHSELLRIGDVATEHDEPHHEGGHLTVPNGNAPFPQR